MTKLFLSLHVLAAVLAIGPVAVAASMFPAALRRATGAAGAGASAASAPDDRDALANLRLLHRVCRVYAAVGTAVPVLGFFTARSLGVLGSGWLIASIVLTTAAAAVLALLILPGQDAALTALQEPEPEQEQGPAPGLAPGPAARSAARLAMLTGVFNLLWATVTVLMIIRPGSTTGA
ncbi:hypothetical protein M8Z33_05715 [Streptomyces sp. ZAF1911]|uniref:hypothetical protein n=1 Tax=Streptomyces sp. ZAF1911 TaxID=2944129 RepID=UPI00237B22C9|nr:hypothetical protein [Streptomyces sp. ZAF1911]MDD9376172.1 hypothetical protein [Streptomyces sp. ZAF1911]